MRLALAASSCLLLAAGCLGDNTVPTGNIPSPDLAMPDLTVGPDLAMPDLIAPLGIGMPCPNGTECAMGQNCLGSRLDPSLPAGGYCTKPCKNDLDCGANAFCGPPLPNAGQICWELCDANGGCGGAPDRVCSRHVSGLIDLVRSACIPGNPNAKDGAACKSWGDCNRDQLCQANPFEAPNGECLTVGCTQGMSATCSPAMGNAAQCLALGGNTVCIPTCAMASDCRMAEGYVCAMIANTMLCVFPHNAPGSSCMNDATCGPPPWRCLMGGSFPNGYCSGALGTCSPTAANSCPNNTHCYDPTPNMPNNGDQYCTRDCAADTDCRMADGYRCRQVANNAMGCIKP
jgi:hypothetical protein